MGSVARKKCDRLFLYAQNNISIYFSKLNQIKNKKAKYQTGNFSETIIISLERGYRKRRKGKQNENY